ncbi:histidine kinase [Frateuria sp. Soil773]|uniref:hybrid sensor histidine kinase/response regulator n=1 Tax=Frateuria sp. Soil773 TaxID=1736407 RepID=UPI0007000AC2|nr:hybrid sensor histidine kinase/response regulator [Frateuria sp. Soil773]KRF00352.1 histidine kinase [Frateuria sp. Soil773]
MLAILLLGAALAVTSPTTTAPAGHGAAPPPIVALDAPARVDAAAPLPTPQFRRFGLSDGMPSSTVNAIEQDRAGFMWFGSNGGLVRYDGVEFKVFHHDAGDPGSISTSDITQLLSDPQGRLWISTGDSGLDRYEPDSGRFLHWRHRDDDPASLSHDEVWSLAAGPDGRLWVGTSSGLDRMLADGSGFEHIAYTLDGKGFGAVRALLAEPDGKLWIGTRKELLLRQPDGRLQRVPMDPSVDRNVEVWRIEGGGDDVRVAIRQGLLRIDAQGVARPAFPGLKRVNVFGSARDSLGQLWAATIRGLLFDDGRGVQTITAQPLLLGGLPGQWVWRVLRDREGGLWFAFYDGGVAYLAPGWNSFVRFTHVPDDPTSLRDTVATAVVASRDQKLWVGSRGKLDKLDPVTGAVEHVVDGFKTEVVSVVEDDAGLWIGTRGQLFRYVGGKLTQVDPERKLLSLPKYLAAAGGDQVYVSCNRVGIFRVDPLTLTPTLLPMAPDAKDQALRPSMLKVDDGVLWYASEGGLMRWNAAAGRLDFVEGVARDGVDAFAFDRDGFWLTRSDALEHYRWRDGKAQRDRLVDARHGWMSLTASDLRVDASGQLWIFGDTGLWRYDPVHGSFRAFGMQDGLVNGEFNGKQTSITADGAIYAPTQGGVIGFRPAYVRTGGSAPELAITRITVRRNGQVVALPQQAGQIRLGWRDRELQVEARAFSYVNPAANHYQFFLKGFDSHWVETGNRGEREFSGLGAGDYTLEVKASGANGAWGELAVPLQIHVQAPPWVRWWAWLLYLVAAVLLVWLVLRSWRRRIGHRHAIQLAEQRGELAEQASAAKTQFLATLSHEIRTPMTGVMGMAELLLTTRLDATQLEYAQAMQRSGSMLLKLLNDTLDLARIEAGRLELEPAPFNPRQLIDDVAQLEQGLAQARGLRFALDVADDLPAWLVGDAVRIKQVLLNLANNALKFTERGSVTLRAERTGGGITLSIVDTGPGIPEASQARLFQRFEQDASPQRHSGSGLGLAICRELVGMMGGSIELESRMGHGSTFRVRLPLPEATDARLPRPLAQPSAQGRYRILLVEDDVIVAAVVRGLLERQGHQVCHVGNGLAAMAEFSQAPFDLVLLDLDLPGVDGFQIARLIRQREAGGRRTPLIAITARTGGDEEARTREAGMDGFLRKPLSGDQLAATMAAVLRELAVAD